jgi:hypothetical protein
MENIQVAINGESIVVIKFILFALFCIVTLNFGDILCGRIYSNIRTNNTLGFVDVCVIATVCVCTFIILMEITYSPNITTHNIYAYVTFVLSVWFGGAIQQTNNGLLGILFSIGRIQSKCLWGLYVAFVVVMFLVNTDNMSIGDYIVYGVCTFIYAALFSKPTQNETQDKEDIQYKHEIYTGSVSIVLMIAPIATMDGRLLWISVFGLLRPITQLIGSVIGLNVSYSDEKTEVYVKSSVFWGEYFWGQIQIFALISGMILLGYGQGVFQTIHQ